MDFFQQLQSSIHVVLRLALAFHVYKKRELNPVYPGRGLNHVESHAHNGQMMVITSPFNLMTSVVWDTPTKNEQLS